MLNKIALLGSSGRMNTAVRSVALKRNLEVEHLSRTPDVIEAELIIDFSVPDSTKKYVEFAQKRKKPILICTTGHQNLDFLIDPQVPICYAPNTCVEWLLMKKCILEIARLNQDSYITVEDIHSMLKRDKPSGTSLNLYRSLIESVPPENLNLTSVRKLEIPSWHKCNIYCENQVILFEHQVLNREIYATGAIKLAEVLVKQKPGCYAPEELLSKAID